MTSGFHLWSSRINFEYVTERHQHVETHRSVCTATASALPSCWRASWPSRAVCGRQLISPSARGGFVRFPRCFWLHGNSMVCWKRLRLRTSLTLGGTAELRSYLQGYPAIVLSVTGSLFLSFYLCVCVCLLHDGPSAHCCLALTYQKAF